MTRLTDERLAAILNPPDIIGETELVSLAREVRELRDRLSPVEACRDKYAERERKAATEMFDERKSMLATIEQLTRERDELQAEHARVKSDLESARWIIRQRDAVTEVLTSQRDAAREFNRRFRACGNIHNGHSEVLQNEIDRVCRDYDASQTQQPQPTQKQDADDMDERLKQQANFSPLEKVSRDLSEATLLLRKVRNAAKLSTELEFRIDAFLTFQKCEESDVKLQTPQAEWVPWTAETRPRGPMTIRKTGQTAAEFAPGWMEYGETSDGSRILFETLLEDYEWSRDGVTWNRCGTEVTK